MSPPLGLYLPFNPSTISHHQISDEKKAKCAVSHAKISTTFGLKIKGPWDVWKGILILKLLKIIILACGKD